MTKRQTARAEQPVVVHLTTTDMSLDWLLRDQLVAQQRAGFTVIGASAAGPHVPALVAAGIRHEPVDSLTRSVSAWRDIRAFVDLVRLFRRLRPTIVHTHNPKPGVLGRIAARLARVPIVVNTQHGLYAQPTDRARRRLPVYAAERLAAAFSHHEFVQSSDDIATLRRLRVPARKLTDLGNGVNLTRFDPDALDSTDRDAVRREWGVSNDAVVAIVVGRLVAEKGIAELIAAARACTDVDNLHIVVVGPNDPDKSDGLSLEDVRRGELAGLRFVGRRDDMPRCYNAADFFVTATYREGFPRAAMEAAAMGLPIVATDIRGCRQVVDHGRTGLLVPVRDATALATAIRQMATGDRHSWSAAARVKARAEFDVERISTVIVDRYRQLLGVRRV